MSIVGEGALQGALQGRGTVGEGALQGYCKGRGTVRLLPGKWHCIEGVLQGSGHC